MLNVNHLSVKYGNAVAIADVSITVGQGEVVAIIGPNGAGKTSMLKAISGMVPVSGGSIQFHNETLNGLAPHNIARKGIAHVPEGRRLFGPLSVDENLQIGMQHLGQGLKSSRVEEVFELFPRLRERRKQKAGTMSGGEQQMLAISRALVGQPKLLMLDEPSMGLAPLIVKEVYNNINILKSNGQTILLVEQNAQLALSISDRCYVLASGRVVLQGEASELRKDKELVNAYLGGL